MNDSKDVSQLSGPRYIAIEGPIGVGKTSLAKRLAESFNSDLVLEQPSENPFLERFYRNRGDGALPTQLFFLFQRARQIEAIRQSDLFSPVRIADFLLEKDRLFAELNLDGNEFALYEQIYENLELDPPDPDLVIYLHHLGSTLLHQTHRIIECLLRCSVTHERQINDKERSAEPTRHNIGVINHVVNCNGNCGLVTLYHHS